jgi:hypothetical protein
MDDEAPNRFHPLASLHRFFKLVCTDSGLELGIFREFPGFREMNYLAIY